MQTSLGQEFTTFVGDDCINLNETVNIDNISSNQKLANTQQKLNAVVEFLINLSEDDLIIAELPTTHSYCKYFLLRVNYNYQLLKIFCLLDFL